MKVPIPPAVSRLPFTVCNSIFGMPAKKSTKAMSRSYTVPSVLLTTENITSNIEAMRSLMEVIIEVIVAGGFLGALLVRMNCDSCFVGCFQRKEYVSISKGQLLT
jgi:hypothetical protein